MPAIPSFYLTLLCVFLACTLPAGAATVNATWNAANDVPVTAASYTATGSTVDFTLNFAPVTGTNLTVVDNTGLPFISGTFDNLAQGQAVALSYGGVTYNYVAHYYGGTGNDLVLVWANQRLLGWGNNGNGQIGDGTTTPRSLMVPVMVTGVLGGKTIVALSQSPYHTLALCSDGTVAAWGSNLYGQLGNNTTTDSYVPAAVNTASGVSALYGKTVVAVMAGVSHSMALCSDGTVAAWGYNFYGELGDKTTTSRSVPVAVNTASGVSALFGKTAVAIAAGNYQSMALCSDGTLVSWGSNFNGELGDNTTTTRMVPVAVNTANGVSALYGKTVTSFTTGLSHSLAICSDGTVVAWGGNYTGRLGDNTTTTRYAPVTVNTASGISALYGKSVIALAAGQSHSLALCSDGTVAAWGDNTYGQLGDNTTTQRNAPVAVNTASGVSALFGKTALAIAVGGRSGSSSGALCADGSMVTWGYNTYGDLGNNSTTGSPVPMVVNTSPLGADERPTVPYRGSPMAQCLMLVAEPSPSLVTLAATTIGGTSATLNGTVNPNNGTTLVSFDYGTTTAYGSSFGATPNTITGGVDTAASATVTGLTPGTTYHYRVRASSATGADQTFTTLNNNAGLANLATSAGSLSPVFASGTTQYTVSLSSATDSITVTPTVADGNATVTVNGTTVVSGSATGAIRLGYGDNVISIMVKAQDGVTTQVYTLNVMQSIPSTLPAAYASATYVPVGSNGFSATGRTVNFSLNFAPAPGTNLTVVNNTGLPFINGRFNNLAQGQGVALNYGGVTYNFVANYYGGTGNDLVLVWANNRAVAWGNNNYGRTGDGTTTQRNVMVPVTATGVLAGKTILALAQSSRHTLALCSDGTLAAWGSNSSGQLGNNTTTNSYVPVAVSSALGVSALNGKTVVAVSAGSSHSVALCSDGTVATWGSNTYGQLGNNTTTASSLPVAVNTANGVSALRGKTVVSVAAGYYHSMALCSDGAVVTWGYNSYGQLGDNTTTQRLAPVTVNTASGVSALFGKTMVAVAAGNYHNMALCTDGTVATWGYNAYGQLGNNSTTNSPVPVAASTASGVSALNGKTVIGLAAGYYHSMALCFDGTVATWGYNNYGQLGDSTTTSRSAPVAVNTASGVSALSGKTVVAIGAGGSYGYSSALCADGTMAAWGYNYYGDLGNNSNVNSSVPVMVNTTPLMAGESMMPPSNSRTTAVSMALVAEPPAGATTLAAAVLSGSSAVLNGEVCAAGSTLNVSFDYGTTTAYGSSIAATPAVVTGGNATAVAATLTGLLPLTTYHFRVNGGAFLGGDQTFTTPNNDASLMALTTSAGSLSPSFTSGVTNYVTPDVPGSTSSITVTPTLSDSSDSLTMTVNGVGVGVASGSPATAGLGYGANVICVLVTAEDGTTTQNYTLTVTRPLPATFAAGYASGGDVPLTSNALLSPAGSTVNLTLSYAPATGANLMVVNNTGLSFINGAFDNLAQGQAVALSYGGVTYHFVANYYGGTGNDLVLVWANNRMLTCGYNGSSQLGDGTLSNRSLPAAVSSTGVLAGKTVIATATGGYHALALCSDGTLASWGNNGYGQLGNNSLMNSSVPVAVNRSNGVSALYGKTVVGVAAGQYFSLALCSDGTVAAWGYNFDGELGDTTTTVRAVPVAVNTGSGVSALYGKKVVEIAAGAYFSLALCDDGSVAAWGENTYGQIGNNSTTDSSVPVAVSTAGGVSALAGKTVVALAAGSDHALALCADGSVVAWGSGYSGQLGNNTSTSSRVPVAVSTASAVSALNGKTVTALAAGGDHNLVLCADGSMAAWGDNTYGDLGNNSTSSSTVPVSVNTTSGVSALYGKTVTALAAGEYHCMALCADGSMAAWGDNTYGDLGTNSTSSSSVPVLVSSSTLAAGEQWSALPGGGNAYRWSLAVAAAPAYATVTTQAATAIGGASATLNSTVVAAYDSMAVSFEYGTDASYGSTAAATPTPVSTGAATPVSAAITGLIPATTYHFRVKGSNGAGMLNGGDLTFTTLNNNASLASLTVSSGTLSPAFSSGTTNYTLNIPFATTAITWAAALADSNASMRINGAQVSSGTFNLAEGGNTLSILVTAQDGGTTQTYTLAVNRSAGPSLSSLGLDSGTLNPIFDSNTTNYAVNVDSTKSAIAVTPSVVDGTTTVKVNGTTVASGSASSPINLAYGDNSIQTAVTSQDGSVTKTYTVLVTRGIPTSFNANFASASIAPLTIRGLTASGSTVALALNFAPVTGTTLTVVNNTSTGLISGSFDNLAQGQMVTLSYNGISYHFIASYFGGTGNDLVLQWADTRAFAWGSNQSYQLGNPAYYFGSYNIPIPVLNGGALGGALSQKKILSLAAGGGHSLALCSDGSVVAWGTSFQGALGNGFPVGQDGIPLAVNTAPAGTIDTPWGPSALYGKSVVAIAAGANHSLALCTDGTVAAWGDGFYGQLGSDAFYAVNQSYVPVAVSTASGVSALAGKTVVAISAGARHNLALCSDGTLAGWGYNANGQLGNLSTGSRMFPQAVNTTNGVSALNGKTVVAISAGGSHSLALCSDGTVAAWGSNAYGQLGDNTTTTRVAPVAVNTSTGVSALFGKTVVAISAGGSHSMALCSDGTVVTWGQNTLGQMGDNTTTQRNAPVAVSKASGVSALFGKTVASISAGYNHCVAKCTDGTVVAWGSNVYGETGAATNVSAQKTAFAVPRTNLAAAETFAITTAGSSSSHSLTLVATPPATVNSLAATAVTSSSVTLNGSVNASNGFVLTSYDFGLSTAYGMNLSASPTSVTGSSTQNTSVTLMGLQPATTYHFRANGGTYSGGDLTFTTLSSLQDWRQMNFGTMTTTGAWADAADFDNDGIPNLIEWACLLDPTTRSTTPVTTVHNGANFEFTYSRSTAAANSGAAFIVEWSDTMAAGSWSSTGVTQTVLSDDGTMQQVKAVIPINGTTAKFSRLSVTAP